MEKEKVDEKGLASRVEELEQLVAAGYENFYDGWDATEWRACAEKLITKRPDSLNSADSASNTESSSTAKETR